MSFAAATKVTEGRTKEEIENLLQKYGAQRFCAMTDWEHRRATVQFCYRNIMVEMFVVLPDPKERRFTHTDKQNQMRSPKSAQLEYEQAIRSAWRSLALLIKAKLVGVEQKVTTFEVEFMPYMVTTDGRTIADQIRPLIEHAKTSKNGIPMRLGLPEPKEDDD